MQRIAPSAWAPALVFSMVLAVPCPATAETKAPAGTAPLQIRLLARALAPGEPVRIFVEAPASLERLSGNFLGRSVDFQAVDGLAENGEPAPWIGWTMIGLDEKPGPQVVELSGHGAEGRAVGGTLGFEIEAREFPTEELTVASKYVEPPPEVTRRIADERKRLKEIYSMRSPLSDPSGLFVRPVPGVETSVFGTRRIFNGQPRDPHSGQDLRAPTGTPVAAAGDGTVRLAEDLYYSGNTVLIDHGGGLFTIYAHLSRIDAKPGESIAAGDRLGLAGATGRVTAPHLHWGAKIDDTPFHPMALLDERLRWGAP